MSNNDHFLKIKLIKNENSIMAQLNQFHNFNFNFNGPKFFVLKKKRERQKERERQRKTERERQHFINASYITSQFSFIITLFA